MELAECNVIVINLSLKNDLIYCNGKQSAKMKKLITANEPNLALKTNLVF